MAVSEQAASAHRAMKEGGGEEATMIGIRGGQGGHIQGVQHIWAPPGDCELLQIPGEGGLNGGLQFTGVGQKPGEGAGGVAEDDEDPQQGGGGDAGFRIFI